MNDLITVMYVFMIGLITGAAFYGSLWWAIRHLTASIRPIRWFLGSLCLRILTVLVSFYLILGSPWELWLIWLLGFIMSRQLVIHFTPYMTQDSHHAS